MRETLAEGTGRPAPGATDQGCIVQREIINSRQRPRISVWRAQFGHAAEGPIRHQFQPQAFTQKRLAAIYCAQHMGKHDRLLSGNLFIDKDLIDQLSGLGCGLATADKLVVGLPHWLKTPAIPVQRVATGAHIKCHRLQAGIGHQGAGHTGVVLEMPVKEPVVAVDILDDAQVAATCRATQWVEISHFTQKITLA